MCGFSLVCSEGDLKLDDELVDELRRRGPHSFSIHQRTVTRGKQGKPDLQLSFVSTVLSLRGESVLQQPLIDEESGSLLCWNGEAWRVDSKTFSGNDAQLVFDTLMRHIKTIVGSGMEKKELSCLAIKRVMSSISGPFSFLFYDAPHARVFYGRDTLGRRSLLFKIASNEAFTLASTTCGPSSGSWQELDADGIYVLDLSNGASSFEESGARKTSNFLGDFCLSWATIELTSWTTLGVVFPNINRDVRLQRCSLPSTRRHATIALWEQLSESLLPRITGIPQVVSASGKPARLAILFSGGLDCTILARLCHDILPADEGIDLLNVAFENPRVLLAAQSRLGADATPAMSAYDACPDRITGLSSHLELQEVCPGRRWNFVSVDIPYEETQAHRDTVIRLMYPHETEMDLSISLALYFAARGRGRVEGPRGLENYNSSALVLLSGLGADELFGGYGRHKVAFAKRGHDGLLDELELDFTRIGKRNLGRDDRVISHWGKEVRYPYLDEAFASWVLERPVWEKCDFMHSHQQQHEEEESHDVNSLPSNEPNLDPEKSGLRHLAWMLGMERVAREKKRAIQFGARTAKMVSGRVKGTQTITR